MLVTVSCHQPSRHADLTHMCHLLKFFQEFGSLIQATSLQAFKFSFQRIMRAKQMSSFLQSVCYAWKKKSTLLGHASTRISNTRKQNSSPCLPHAVSSCLQDHPLTPLPHCFCLIFLAANDCSYSFSREVSDAKLDLAFSLRWPLGQLQSTMRWLFTQINWRKIDSLCYSHPPGVNSPEQWPIMMQPSWQLS